MSLRFESDLRAQPGPQVEIRVTDPSGTPGPVDGQPDQAFPEWTPLDDATGTIRVTAVLVAHDGAAFLPRTLDAIDAQSRRPDNLIAVDAGSLDGGADLLSLATGRLLRVNRDTSFGDAVQAALTALDGTALQPAPNPRPDIDLQTDPITDAGRPAAPRGTGFTDWLWLLHDDSAPAPDALALLIEAVDGGPSIGIAGCKQVSWDDGRRLLDVGFTTSRLGARVTGIDVDDVDQGQLDHRSDVLAVSTAGMLVRREVWDRLGGPDPALAHARDDLDLCRRAHLAGLRVVVVPQAVIAHAAATATGRRGTASALAASGSTGASWGLRDRRAAVHLRLASVPLLLLPFLVLWLAAAALVRAAGRLVLKQPQRAAAELAAFGLAVTRPMAWMRARRRVRAGRTLPRRDFRRLLAGPRPALRQRRDAVSAYLRAQDEAWAVPDADRPVPATGSVGTAEATPGTPPGVPAAVDVLAGADADPGSVAFDDDRELARRPPVTRIGFTVAALVGLAGLAGLQLLLRGTGVPVGPALLPAPDTAGRLWAEAMSGWRPTGLGRPGPADPFDALLALIAWPLGGSTRIAAELLLLGALPLAALLAWWAAGGVTRSRALRAWAALGWAAAPSLLAVVAAGRLGAIVAHLALPPAALALARTIGARPAPVPGDRMPIAARAIRARGSISAASGAGLMLTVLIAAAPALAVPALIALLLTAVVARRGRSRLAWVAAVPAVLLLPWWLAVARDPWLLLAEPGGASAGGSGAPGWSAALWPADPAVLDQGPVRRAARFVAETTSFADASFWLRAFAVALAVPLLVLGLSALLRRGRGRPASVLWIAGLTGLVVAVLVPLLDVRSGPDGELHGWSGAGVSLLTFGALAAALLRLDGAAGRLRSRSLGSLHWLAVGTGVLALLAPVTVLAGWSVEGWAAGPDRWVHRASPDVLPAVATAEAASPAATRTLVLRTTSAGVRWSLYRTGGPQIGQESAATLSQDAPGTGVASEQPVLDAIGGLLSDSGTDQTSRLADLGVGSVLLLAPADDDATVALDTAPGLVRVATPNGGVLWRVELSGEGGGATQPARVRVLSADGTITQTLPSDGLDVRTSLASGPAGRQLVLAERADSGWQARLDGVRLPAITHNGWAQAFELPATGGVLTVEHTGNGSGPIGLARLVVAGLALLLAVPLPGRRPRLLPPPRPLRGPRDLAPVETSGRRARLDPEEPSASWPPEPEPPPGQPVSEVAVVEPEPVEPEPVEAELVEPEPVEAELVEPEPVEAEPVEAALVPVERVEPEVVVAELVSDVDGVDAEVVDAEVVDAEVLEVVEPPALEFLPPPVIEPLPLPVPDVRPGAAGAAGADARPVPETVSEEKP